MNQSVAIPLLKKLPQKPGVYLFCNADGYVIYIGKAKNLKSRVRSYFTLRPSDTRYEKLLRLTAETARVRFIEVTSEVEALLLEAELIHRHQPRYNTQWHDDASPLYIKITVGEPLPKVTLSRREKPSRGIRLFGPFPSTGTVKVLMRQVRRVFPFYTGSHHPIRSCLYCHMQTCPGPQAKVSKITYRSTIRRLILFLSGKKTKLSADLTRQMKRAADSEQFEEADRVKRLLAGIDYVTQPIRHPQVYIEKPTLLVDERNEALKQLASALGLLTLPKRIECYDIANLSGTAATGAMVVTTAGELDKSQYRKFKIRIKSTQDDVGMLEEVLTRRLKNEWPLPDLLVVDGGIAQSRVAKRVLSEKGLTIPCVGLAKRYETIVFPDGKTLELERRNMGLKLLQNLRNEAHRFSRAYHHLLRAKKILPRLTS